MLSPGRVSNGLSGLTGTHPESQDQYSYGLLRRDVADLAWADEVWRDAAWSVLSRTG